MPGVYWCCCGATMCLFFSWVFRDFELALCSSATPCLTSKYGVTQRDRHDPADVVMDSADSPLQRDNVGC